MSERYCSACRIWHDRKLGACPQCGRERYGFNKHLRTADLNNNLHKQIEHAKQG